MGADVLVNYTEEGWEEKVLEATGGKGVDFALELAGGRIFNKSLKCLATFRRLAIYGVASGEQSFYLTHPINMCPSARQLLFDAGFIIF